MANVVDLNKQRMDALTAGLPSKSAKMRRLAKAGFKRADIARYLGVRYQFVYNVLSVPGGEGSAAKRHAKIAKSDSPSTASKMPMSDLAVPRWVWLRVEKGGRLDLPAAFLGALGVRDGDQVQLALERDSIRVLTRAAALRELRARAQAFVPDGASLVDELIAERRAEAETDAADG